MFTDEELKVIRKCLQCVRFAQMVAETHEGEDYKDTKIDALIFKIKALEGHSQNAEADQN